MAKDVHYFTDIRRQIDDAITYDDWALAYQLADRGFQEARDKEILDEMMFFTAQLAIVEEDYEAAIRYLDLAIKYNPKDGGAYNDRALSMIELGQIDEALSYFNKGIEVEPDFATIHHNKGWYLNKIGQHKEAVQCFRKALEFEPDRAVTYENLADAYRNIGDIPRAIEACKTAMSVLPPTHEEIKKQLEEQLKSLEG